MSCQQILQFDPLESAVDLSFWESLAKRKIEIYKLDDSEISIFGTFQGGRKLQQLDSNKSITKYAIPCRISVTSASFNTEAISSNTEAISSNTNTISSDQICYGILKNTNTIEEFKDLDKNSFLKKCSKKIWDAILDKSALKNPQILSTFALITFSDLKKYKFYYWFAFPALIPPLPFTSTPPTSLQDQFPVESFSNSYQSFKSKYAEQSGFFLVKKKQDGVVVIRKLGDWSTFWSSSDIITVGFVDPSAQKSNPGWPLRNFLFLIQKEFNLQHVDVIALRDTIEDSIHFQVHFDTSQPISHDFPLVIGWEKGPKGTPTPRVSDLGPMMDPARLADTAVDLNLKLMRWRILPELNLENISQTRCLLLGAGTLGCYVGRILLAWGVRHITFVDNGKVSFSNPVRQPLFSFQDCLNGGAFKAESAAKSLKEIFPGVKSQGINLSIPMPGHSIDDDAVISDRIDTLTKLVSNHDAIFLLTDSRESRWLPTLLCAIQKKIVINTALGFDSYLVMRHGYRDTKVPPTEPLGCYFCNDVVAPVDSLSDRTLDQQCTVTRPGLSGMASAMAVELLASILNHPDKIQARGDISGSVNSTPLGLVPHQIRGFLSSFSTMVLNGSGYDKCTACSTSILSAYEKDGTCFLLKALRTPSLLEEISGLKEMKKQVDLDDFESDGEGEDF